MKKFLLSAALLFSAAGAWAQTAITSLSGLNNTSFYTIDSEGRGYLKYDATKGDFVSADNTSNVVATNAADATTEQFAFLRIEGMTDGQYYLYSRAAQKFVTFTGEGSGNNIQYAQRLTENPVSIWNVSPVTSGGVTYFVIDVAGTSNHINVTNWNHYLGCKVVSGSYDGGNRMIVTNVASGETEATAALKKIETHQVSLLTPVVENLKTLKGLGYPKETSDAYRALHALTNESGISDINEAINNFIYCEDIEKPVSGKAYTIKAWWKTRQLPFTFFEAQENGVYAGYDNGYAPTEVGEAVKFVCQEVDGKYIFVSDNGYYLGIQADGKNSKTSQTYNANQLLNAVSANVASRTSRNSALTTTDLLGKFCLKGIIDGNANHNMMYSYSTKKFHNQTAGSTPYGENALTVYYVIEEAADYTTNVINASAQLNSEYVSTFYAPYATTLPENCTAYTINTVNGDYAMLNALTGDIPANTGVIVTAPSAGKLTLGLSTSNPTAEGITNLLHGSVADSYVAVDNAYVLANGSNGVGMYKPTGNKNADGTDGTGYFKNNAGKAYMLYAGTTAPMLAFDFATGIRGVEATKANGAIYDLSGRRVKAATKGIFIINGKKVIK